MKEFLIIWLFYCIQLVKSLNSTECERDETCKKPECLEFWWNNTANIAELLAVAAVMVFLATFVPKIIVRLVFFSLAKIRYIRLIMIDFGQYCLSSTTYLLSASLVWGALVVAKLDDFLCLLQVYIWGIFFLIWIFSLFNVIQDFAVRRWGGGVSGDLSKRVIITESVKLFRLVTLVIVSAVIYLRLFGIYQEVLMYSIFGMVGICVALGSVSAAHNAIGGLYLVFHAPFKVDDFIEIGIVKGTVQRVALRYTSLTTLDGTTTFTPNSFFLYKPMINYSQRPKRQLEIFVEVASTTPVELLEKFINEAEVALQTLHVGLTSHYNNLVDLQDSTENTRYFFVAMDSLFKIRIYSFTQELDVKKHALIKSEVWLAITEIVEELGIEMISSSTDEDRPTVVEDDVPFAAEFGFFTGSG